MGNFTQLDAYSRLKCHETLFSNLNSNRHTETSAFIYFTLVTHSKSILLMGKNWWWIFFTVICIQSP